MYGDPAASKSARFAAGLPTRGEIAIGLLLGLAACFIPILRTLGYESAILLAAIAGSVALRRGLLEGRVLRARADSEASPADWFRLAGDAFSSATIAALLVLLPPLALLAATTRVAQGCRLGPGLELVLFIALPAAPHLAACGLSIGAAFRRRAGRASALALLAGLHILHVASQAYTGRTNPHSILLGFLSISGWGGIGSADLDLPASYYLLRGLAVASCPLLTGLAGLSLWRASGRRGIPRRAPPVVAFALAVLPVAVGLCRPSAFGLTSGVGVRERQLAGRSGTEHIVVRFAPQGRAAAQAGAIASDAEWDFEIDSAVMHLRAARPVTVWVYDSEDDMKRLTGAEDFVFALPWRRELHTVFASGGAASLRHELVHVLAAEWTRRPLSISWNQAMLEGTAEAIASGAFLGGEFQETAAAALSAGRLSPAPELFRPGGFAWGAGAIGTSYRFAASFIGFLLERYGPGPVSLAYGGESWSQAFGKSLDELDVEWRDALSRVPVSEGEREWARSAFDPQLNPSFVDSPCPRVGLARPPRGPAEEKPVAADSSTNHRPDKVALLLLRAKRALGEGHEGEAQRLYARVIPLVSDPSRRLAAEEGLARARRIPAGVFLRAAASAIQSGASMIDPNNPPATETP